ncbi:uncharacterized protein LOC109829380 isoform X2 [Asparagus officinalis]|uniref:uncharacterized protein LOC109829380 isoform X2 n=1 Tax=Asparagus officinalis TaxID=4686 RepID=UPI00098E254B|nr:uncharacterized protein LOC109829380 isoform X2 [Asparagus officinalis]
MTEAWIRSLVEAIHSSSTQTVIYLAGGASQAIAWLMSTPGASNTILEVLVPYSRTSMVQLLGKVPAQFTSQQTVEELALLAYNRALKLSKPGFPVLGVGFTGSLVSIHPKHGNHRFYLSTRTCDRLRTSNITLVKGMRTREEEDKLASHFMLKSFDEDQELQQIIDGNICMKIYHFLQDAHIADTERKVILSGSFNPLHDGHVRLLEIASSICGDGLPCFEISAINADKPPLEVSEIKKRVEQFRKAGKTVIISNQPYFHKKAELFPGSAFVIGADTAARIVNPKYYGGDKRNMLDILIGCKMSGCMFLVGGRKVDGNFKVLEDLDIPEELKDMFVSIPEEKFRMDISSTEIRRNMGV